MLSVKNSVCHKTCIIIFIMMIHDEAAHDKHLHACIIPIEKNDDAYDFSREMKGIRNKMTVFV